ncbi:hypothetical protein RB595_010191 [Gaeumannomyces hyphopodioides]
MRAYGILYALFAALRVGAQAVAAGPSASSDLQVQGSYIVELEPNGKIADFYQTLSSTHGIKTQQRMNLGSSKIFNGASFKVLDAAGLDDAKLMDLLTAAPAVRRVWPVRKVTLSVPKTEDPANHTVPAHAPGLGRRQDAPLDVDPTLSGDNFMPHLMTQIDKLHAKNITGKGFKIAMMDSGIDYTHPALGGCFGPGCLVEGGWDFVGDAPFGSEPQPDADPYDGCMGHGTHVAGTIAAQAHGNKYGFVGAAPGVKLWAYRCWNCASVGSNEILVAAFVRAYEDGADILQCSNGNYDNGGWEDEPWAHVAGRIAQTGVPVIISAGNSGGRGLFSASTPASGKGVQAVAAVQNRNNPIFVSRGTYKTDASGVSSSRNQSAADKPYGFFAGSPWPEETVTLPLWSIGNDTTSENDACSPLPENTPDLSDKLVLLRQPGTRKCFPQDQGENILAKGGRYIAYYAFSNNTWDAQFVYVDGIKGVTSVSPAQGAAWIEMLSRGVQVNVTIPKKADAPENMLMELEDNATGGYVSTFSSWGPNWDLVPYPHVGAPGGRILSTFPVPMGSYRVMSGTSMACPLVAGLVALMGEARGGKLDGDLFGRIMSSTAKPLTWFDGTKASPGILAPPAQGGAGMVQAYDAAFAKTVLDKRNIALNDSAHFVADHEFTIQNVGDEEATYEVGHMRSPTMYTTVSTPNGDLTAGAPNPIVEGAWAELTFNPDTVTVPAGGSAKVKVTVAPPAREGLNASRLPIYSGYVSINSTRAEHLVLPYLGMVGSIHDKPVVLAGVSYLASFGSPVAANTSYTLPPPDPKNPPSQKNDNGKLPSMLLTMTLGTRVLHVHVASLSDPARNTGRTPTGVPCVGEPAGSPLRFVASFSQRVYLSGLLGDGSMLPAGSYKMVASALRIFGDESVPADWDVVETVPFSIQYSNGTAAAR